MALALLLFLGHTLFAYWVVFRDGAEVMEGWKAFFFIDWFAGLMSPQQLRLYVGASWVLSAGWLLYGLAKGSIG
jgi:hypothetical protein